MKKQILLLALFLFFFSNDSKKIDDFPVLKGPYLGQKPPGIKAEIFATGIISLRGPENRESDIIFWPDGNRFVFARWGKGIPEFTLFESRMENGIWTKPETSRIFPKGGYLPCVSPDGKKIIFTTAESAQKWPPRLYLSQEDSEVWSPPRLICKGMYASMALDGTIYYADNGFAVFRRYINGVYAKKERVGEHIYSGHDYGHLFIAPDKSYLLFGDGELFVSFPTGENAWSKPKNISDLLGIQSAGKPRVTYDGKYLFFTSRNDIYWADAKIIDDLRPDELKKSRDDCLQKYLQLSKQAYQSKNYKEYQRLMSRIVELEPQNYKYRYNLACAGALNGEVKNPVKILQFLLNEDYDLAILAETDSDFDQIKNTLPFKKIIKLIKKKTQPINKSHVAFSIPEKDLIPEGIAYDPVDKAFYLGSVQKCKIIKVDKHAKISDFTKPRQDGLISVLGMRVDSKKRFLWAVSSYGFYRADIPRELLGTTGVFKYDLKTKKLLKKYMLPQEENHMLNDLTIASNGDVYITDWRVPAIYFISLEKNTIEKYYDLPRRPNGIDFSRDGTKLFIAGNGIGVLDIRTKTFRELKHPVNMYLSGDGLYYYQNSLIAIQNGGLRKVTQFFLNEAQDEIVRSRALEAYHSLFNLPTTGVIVGKYFYYIANSQLRAYDKDGNLFPLNKLEETKILKVKLQ